MAAPGLESAIVGRGKYLRPTSVTGRPAAGYNIAIQVTNLRDVQKIPEQLRATYVLMLERLRQSLERAARDVVPGSPTGRLGRTVHARLVSGGGVSNRLVIGTVGSDFAKALNRGFTSKAITTGGKALRFEDGGEVFYRPKVRVAGRHFYEKWLEITPPIVEAIYEQSFYNIKDLT